MLSAVLALAFTLCPLQSGGDDYRSLFDRGVAALDAGETQEAAALFRAAGEHAPDAPVWQAYLARAEERDLPPRKELARLDSPWEIASTRVNSTMEINGSGEQLIAGHGDVSLLDVRTGVLIARLTSRLPNERGFWTFDDTGAVVVGLPNDWGRSLNAHGIDVRDARTGRPLEIEGVTRLTVPSGSRFEWFPAGTPPTAPVPRGAQDFAGPDGTLRLHRVEKTKGLSALMSPDRARALVYEVATPTMTTLVDRTTGEVMKRINPGTWPVFSADGSYFSLHGIGALRVFDARSGEELGSFDMPQAASIARVTYAFRGDEFVRLDPDGTLTAIDLATREERECYKLEPVPTHLWGGIRFVRDGTLLVAFGFEETSCYDATSGARLWRSEGGWLGPFNHPRRAFDDAEGLIATHDGDDVPIVLDVVTGERVEWTAPTVVRTEWVTALRGEQSAVVTSSDGSLRVVRLEDGATLASAAEHVGRSRVAVRTAGDTRIISGDEAGLVVLRQSESLAAISTVQLVQGKLVRDATEDGRLVAVSSPGSSAVRLYELSDGEGRQLARIGGRFPAVAYSPDGTRLALAREGQLLIVDSRTGAVIHDHAILAGVNVSVGTFHGDDLVALGWASETVGGATIVRVDDGSIVATLDSPGLLAIADRTMFISSHVDIGLVVFTVSEGGYVRAYRDTDWSHAWTLPSFGGNWGTLRFLRRPGESLAYVAGMGPSKSCVLDAASGRIVESKAVHGLIPLEGTDESRYVIGVHDGAMSVLDGETHELLYRRYEAADGAAWIERDGKRFAAPGPAASANDPTHLIRKGWSAPVDCWDAWLIDPLGLCAIALSELPELPVILAGSARVASSRENEIDVILRVRSALELKEVLAREHGGSARYVPLDLDPPDGDGVTTVRATLGHGKADLELRVVSESGTTSRPYRIRIER